jgi:hypothetical protein
MICGWDGTGSNSIRTMIAAGSMFDKYQKLYVLFELLMMGVGTA